MGWMLKQSWRKPDNRMTKSDSENERNREKKGEHAGTSFSWFVNRMLTKGSIADHMKN